MSGGRLAAGGVAFELVRRAILLGGKRKTMRLLDRPGGRAAAEHALLRRPAGGVGAESLPASYRRHVEFNLRRCERLWRKRPAQGAEI